MAKRKAKRKKRSHARDMKRRSKAEKKRGHRKTAWVPAHTVKRKGSKRFTVKGHYRKNVKRRRKARKRR